MTPLNSGPPTTYIVFFDFLGSSYAKTAAEAALLGGSIQREDPGNLHRFTNLCASRTQVEKTPEGNLGLTTSFVRVRGPFTTAQFIKMMQFSNEIPNSTWNERMVKFQTSTSSESEKKKDQYH